MLKIRNGKLQNYGNRGMTLESDINLTNDYYQENNIALIYKKPIPIKVLKVSPDKTRIKDGFYEKKSTLDYNGLYQGRYLEFDAKETDSKTSFPISNIHLHQIEHIKKVLKHHGTAFLIIRFNLLNQTYLLMGTDLINFISDNDRKSIPLSYFEEHCEKITLKYRPRIDYLNIINKLWKEDELNEKNKEKKEKN